MNLSLNWISNKLVEIKVDDLESGTLDQEQARELARNLISIADELLSVED